MLMEMLMKALYVNPSGNWEIKRCIFITVQVWWGINQRPPHRLIIHVYVIVRCEEFYFYYWLLGFGIGNLDREFKIFTEIVYIYIFFSVYWFKVC